MRNLLVVLGAGAVVVGCPSFTVADEAATDGGPTNRSDAGILTPAPQRIPDAGRDVEGRDVDQGDEGIVIDDFCTPGDVSSFAPTWKPPAPNTGACLSDTQAEQTVLCALDSSQDQTACKAFINDKANDACEKCVFTSSSAPTLGPLVELPGAMIKLNIPGCLAKTSGDATANGCGSKLLAADQCAEAACADNCPIPSGDEAAIKALNDCEMEAQAGACKAFNDEAACADDLMKAGGVSESCALSDDFITTAVQLAKLFCVLPPSDGGGPG